MKIIDAKWYSAGSDCFGIVLTQDDDGEHKAYLGKGKGVDEAQDCQRIANSGASFHQGPALWPHIEKWRS